MSGAVGQIGRLVPVLQDKVLNAVASDKAADGNFSEVFADLINSVNTLQTDAAEMQQLAATGEVSDLHDVMIALEKAGIAMDLLLEIRNKLVDAYQTIVKMPM